MVSHAPRAALLVDAEEYYRAFAAAAERAVQSIVILGWDFDSRTPLNWGPTRSTVPVRVGDFLNFLVKRHRGLHIYILNWDYPMLFAVLFGTDRETRPLYGLTWKPRRGVHLRYDNTHPIGGSHHQKIVVIDDALAFAGGLDLTSRRWDTCEHAAHDKRRELDGNPYAPFHDTMAAVDGEAARALAAIARERWQLATGETIPPVTHRRSRQDPWPAALEPDLEDVTVAISRTIPQTSTTAEVREVEALYLDMIAAARRYIYIENQYFTSDKIGAALAARLAEPDPPEIVLVTRLLSHGWLEEKTMHELRTHLLKGLRDADRRNKFQVYYPHVPGLDAGTCIDVHSKLMAIDNEWLRIGSANLSNRSMGFDTECDLTFEARRRPDLAQGIRNFRDRLLAEHLGTPIEQVRAAVEGAESLHAAIKQLQSDGRSLRVLDALPEPSGAILDLASVADPERPVSIEQLVDQFAPDTELPRRGPAWIKLGLIAVVMTGLALAWRYTPLAELVTAEKIIAGAQSAGEKYWTPFAVITAYTVAGSVMFPRPLITLFAVMAFGPVLGFVYALTGILVAAVATYYTGRALPRDTVRRLAGERLNNMNQVLRRRGLLMVFAMSIVPVAPFVVIGLVAGAIHIKLWHYALGTLLGMLPGTLATSIFGHQLKNALEDPARINYWLVAGVALCFLILILSVRRWFRSCLSGLLPNG